MGCGRGPHYPRSGLKYQQENDRKGSLNFPFTNDHKTTLTFCQVIILLCKGYRVHGLTKSSMLRSPPVLASRPYNFLQLIDNLLIYFPQYGPLRGSVVPRLCVTIKILISDFYSFWDNLWMIKGSCDWILILSNVITHYFVKINILPTTSILDRLSLGIFF